MKRDWVAIKMTPKMAKAVLAAINKSRGHRDKLLRRRLYRIASLVSTDYGAILVREEDEARNLIECFRLTAFDGRLAHHATRSALFGRIAGLERFLGRSIVDTIALLGKKV